MRGEESLGQLIRALGGARLEDQEQRSPRKGIWWRQFVKAQIVRISVPPVSDHHKDLLQKRH